MINLYVDDIRVCPDGWTCARSVGEAMAYLKQGDVLQCSLDHDMGDRYDGTALVRWMVESGFWPKVKPTVHSDNHDGRARMESMIDQFFGQPALGPMF